MIKQFKVIFIPGNGGGPILDEEGWFPYLKIKLEKLGLLVEAQDFPDPVKARAKYWLPFIEKLGANERTILIGHSSGAVAAMRFVQSHKILGSVLVGAYYTDLGMENEKISGYFNKDWDWEKIRENQKWILQFNSIDDPWIPIEEARHVHQNLKTDYFEFKDRGHFGGDRECREIPEIVEEIKKRI